MKTSPQLRSILELIVSLSAILFLPAEVSLMFHDNKYSIVQIMGGRPKYPADQDSCVQ